MAAVSIAASLAITANGAGAATSTPFVSFNDFLTNTAHATYPRYSAKVGSRGVANQQAFNEMRSYILGLYKGVKVTHSFADSSYYVDCVDTMTQPTVQKFGIKKLASPPAPVRPKAAAPQNAKAVVSPLTMGRHDAYGNAISCGAHTIPMRRASLDLMTAFPTLRDYMAKEPIAGKAPASNASGLSPEHRHAVGYQYVNNSGGNSWLNVWNPSGDYSLSQQWYKAGPDPLYGLIQTAEGGWMHYPAHFGTDKAVLFIYYTPANYYTGCVNLECPGFVQTNSNWPLGATFANYSTYGGPQYGFNEQWNFQGGNWWLFLGEPGQAIGYYPSSAYTPGPMTQGATFSEFGGETATSDTTNWPQMGSGNWSNRGFGQAAYQRNAFYITPTGNNGVSSSLTPYTSNPNCYYIDYTPNNGGSWGTYFYYGGPGGNC
jgi:hypothetical protein